MNSHKKKLIAPIIITSILVLYYLSISIALIFFIKLPTIWKLLFAILPLPLAGISIYVLLERIKEIKSGEEDDLHEY